jgi:hypothetical protein
MMYRGLSLFTLVVAIAACSSKSSESQSQYDEPPAEPESKPIDAAVFAGPMTTETAFSVELDEGATVAEVSTIIERRLAQMTTVKGEVVAADDAVSIRLPAMPEAELERALLRLTRRAKIEYRIVDASTALMRDAYEHAKQDAEAESKGIGAHVDQWRHVGKATDYTDYYLAAKDHAVLEAYLAGVATPDDDHLIAYEMDPTPLDRPGPEWRTYYVWREVHLATDAIERAELMFNTGIDRSEALITFTEAGKQAFAELTKSNVGNKLAIFVDGVIVSAPVIMSEIAGGQTTMSSGADPETAKRDAEELVELLKLGALPAQLTLGATKKL